MRILVVCHRFPYPPQRGGKIRPFNVIRHLHNSGHEVVVASLARSDQEALEGRGLAPHCTSYRMETIRPAAAVANMVARLPTREPSSMGFFFSPRLARAIHETLASQRFDLIFTHCSSVAPYVASVRGIPKILDFGDMDSQKWLAYSRFKPFPLSLGYRLEGSKLERAELELARQFDYCTCTTRAELETLESYGSGARTGWFPNGVDSERFQPDGGGYDPQTICFVGRMDYYPNQQAMFDFCRDVLPLLRERRPELRLTIVGADPSPAVRRLGRVPGVTVTGSVPQVGPHVQRAALSVVPLSIARGTQNKILESLAMGVPVVSSELAAGGVDAVPGEHLLTVREPRDYRDAILRLVDAPVERARFAAAGRARMLSHHAWARSMQVLDTIIEDCVTEGRRAAPAAGRSAG